MRKKYNIDEYIQRKDESDWIPDITWADWITQILSMEPESEVKEIVSRQPDCTEIPHV